MIWHGWLSQNFQLHSVVMYAYSNKVASPSGVLVKVSCEESLLEHYILSFTRSIRNIGIVRQIFGIVSRSKQSFE